MLRIFYRFLFILFLTTVLYSCRPESSVTPQAEESELEFSLPSFFCDNMVLQRESDVRIWGKCSDCGRKIKLTPSWSGRSYTAKVGKNNCWEVTVRTPEAGGPYTIAFDGFENAAIENVMIGDVWFCSGQSNMELLLSGFLGDIPYGGTEAIEAADPAVPIRMFISEYEGNVLRWQYSNEPKDDLLGTWRVNNSENAAVTSALAYFFASRLNSELNVPIGIIVCSIGATSIFGWMSSDAIKPFDNIDGETYKTASLTNASFLYHPVVLYNALINPFVGYSIKGMLWYQGETNSADSRYCDYQAEFARDLREKWNIGDFPFYFFQLAPYSYDDRNATVAAEFRETQEKSLDLIPNSAMICLLDLGDENNIHPLQKKAAAERCADYALAMTYGRTGIHYICPAFESLDVDGDVATVNISCVKDLAGKGNAVGSFELAGIDGVLYPADATVNADNTITVTSAEVPDPVEVRYCFHNYDEATVFDEGGLPLKPFRAKKH